MTGEQLYLLSKESPAAQVCIPLELIPTMPRLSYDNGWIAEFWYHREQYSDNSIYAPQRYLALRLPGALPMELRTVNTELVCIGTAQELLTKDYYDRHNAYLDRCAQILSREEAVTAEEIEALQTQWQETLPKALTEWMNDRALCRQTAAKPDGALQPANSVEYWQQEMADALDAGDMKRVQKAQKEMNRAAKQLRTQ